MTEFPVELKNIVLSAPAGGGALCDDPVLLFLYFRYRLSAGSILPGSIAAKALFGNRRMVSVEIITA
ncbi:hypothetical protein M0G74_15370 [Microbulbifer sp. CAU 1566]|uniref:hypothetical protein n=1 Tax=unclassified Microbulbifer TaxID=2619833 RepID=UPI001358939E|nr:MULTISPECIES: hypothetical protein [unclassified Microbulbifer]MCK7598657.1 hypothetical protein [Microbulbifer sp. CAU 1566]